MVLNLDKKSGIISWNDFGGLAFFSWFGFSILFPTVFFLILAVWLQDKFGLGLWIVVVLGIVGLLTSVSTARSCLKALRKAADESSSHKDPPVSFNDHK